MIVLSEILYYFDEATLEDVITKTTNSLLSGGTVVTTHWRHERHDQLWTADEINDFISNHKSLTRITMVQDPDFLVDVYTFAPTPLHDENSLSPSVGMMYGVV